MKRIGDVIGLVLVVLIAPLSIDLEIVPITLQTFILFTVASWRGAIPGLYIALAYVLLGAVGLPVFSGHSSGWEKLIGPTAGFIWAFPFVSYVVGWLYSKTKLIWLQMGVFFLAHLLLMAFGLSVLKWIKSGVDVWSIAYSILPGAIIKSIVAAIVVKGIKKADWF